MHRFITLVAATILIGLAQPANATTSVDGCARATADKAPAPPRLLLMPVVRRVQAPDASHVEMPVGSARAPDAGGGSMLFLDVDTRVERA